MADIFRDYVPEGEDAGALDGKGYQDFVPEREPELQQLPTETVIAPKKGKKAPKLSKEDLEDLGVKTEEVEEQPAEPVTSPEK